MKSLLARSQISDASGDLAVRGLIFDVQRASMNDGPGLRTTVFLKGCPLRCNWCHNPESRSARSQLSFDPDRCINCRSCESACRQGAHSFVLDTAKEHALRHRVDWSSCRAAGDCVKACPTDALRLYGSKRSVAEIMAEVCADRAYYEASGGGLTISGGEATAQPEFCLALLRCARAEGIHTCVETCGFTSATNLDAFRPLVNLFLFDYKATGDGLHRTLTGVGSELILANLRRLYASGASILLRCPMIPNVNDTPEHFAGIAALRKEMPGLLGVEILPYHATGESKYARIGLPTPFPQPIKPTAEREARWQQQLAAAEGAASSPG